ncbi:MULTISPECIES: KilA-N domain-containing protein [Citrobacter freundii complex]|uniref:KilA-N domain-containing protein n=1 Tax=Citrobacter freundii complex TaxID=1344959 RepID=UPI0023B159B4|nr:KilA-N domain-containing protein [Citrobacter freundii]EKQ7213028.1 KilA-N domain-containing protein [Citrobacter freundii]HCB1565927.1 KilA-N domain-containing protein [Citrobacter freundii]HEB2429503.1 KilA-N domain-containing protein [Citrobacter freundii]HEJ0145182.1 KilA-N domain-containing protein [Citrobacter freundii]
MNTTKNEIAAPVICGVEITTDAEGRFNLNALHRASGKEQKNRPNYWLTLDSTKALISELERSITDAGFSASVIKTIKGGLNQGSFAHELLAIEYAGWISPAFRLQVNQTFLDYRTGKLTLPAEHSASHQLIQSQQRQIELLEELLMRERENSQLRAKLEEKNNHHQPLTNQELLRERDELAEQLGRSRNYATLDAVERKMGREYQWHRLRNWCLRNNVEPLVLRKFQCVHAWPRGAWLDVYGVDLEELFG